MKTPWSLATLGSPRSRTSMNPSPNASAPIPIQRRRTELTISQLVARGTTRQRGGENKRLDSLDVPLPRERPHHGLSRADTERSGALVVAEQVVERPRERLGVPGC